MSTTPTPAELVKQARRTQGLSQAAFAREIAKTQVLVSKYEASIVQPPASVIMHCMHVLGQVPALALSPLPPTVEAVRLAADELRRAVDRLIAASVSARDTEGSHPPDSRAVAPKSLL